MLLAKLHYPLLNHAETPEIMQLLVATKTMISLCADAVQITHHKHTNVRFFQVVKNVSAHGVYRVLQSPLPTTVHQTGSLRLMLLSWKSALQLAYFLGAVHPIA